MVNLTAETTRFRLSTTVLLCRWPALWVYFLRRRYTSPSFEAGFDLRKNRPQPLKPRAWLRR